MKQQLLSLAAAIALAMPMVASAQTAYEVKPGTVVNGGVAGALGDLLLFSGSDGTPATNGLWKSDGTAAGTVLLHAFSFPINSRFVACNGVAFFFAPSGGSSQPLELWRTDGTAAGTFLVQGGLPSVAVYFSDSRTSSACVGRTFFYLGDSATSYFFNDLRRSDGTPAGTFTVVPDLYQPAAFTNVRGTLFFRLDGNVSRSDGTTAGTTNIWPSTGYSDVMPAGAVGSQLYAVRGFSELWRTDGTAAGWVRLLTSDFINGVRALGTKSIFFSHGLWTSDGTATGTTTLRWPMTQSGSSTAPAPVVSSGRYFFRAFDSGSSTETLWKSDGTAAGTAELSTLPNIQMLTDADGALLFGTSAGTWMTDGNSAPVSVSTQVPAAIAKAGTRAFIVATDPLYYQRNKLLALDLSFAASTVSPSAVPVAGGSTITITGTGFGAGTTVAVDGIAVTPANITTTALTFTAPAHAAGTFDVTVTNASGRQARMENVLTYTCDATAVASGSTTSCALVPVPLLGSGGVSCAWLPPTGLSDPSSCTPTASPAVTTTYRLTVVNGSGCVSTNAADVTVTVKPLPATTITLALSPLFDGNSTASVPDAGAGASYQWSISGGQIVSDPAQRTITFRNGCTTARLNVTITPANGCAASGSIDAKPLYPRSVSTVAPQWGPDGTPITLTGQALDCVTAIRFGQRWLATSFHVDSTTQITTALPAGVSGGKVEVQIDGAWITAPGTFYRSVLRKRGDMDGDGKADLVFRNPSTGLDAVWVMNGTQLVSVTNVASFPNSDYHIVGMADFDRNGTNDLLLHNRVTGANAIWWMYSFTFGGVANVPAIPDTNFEVEGTGDFNGDAYPDILVRNQVTGANAVWLMNGAALQSTANLPALPNSGYRIAGTADFNGDGKADIVWRNASTGANAVWLMNGTAYLSTLNLPALPNSAYAIGGIADFNGDGKPDLAWRNASTGANALWLLDGGALTATVDLPAVTMQGLEMAGPR